MPHAPPDVGHGLGAEDLALASEDRVEDLLRLPLHGRGVHEADRGHARPHTSRAVSTIIPSLAHCSSSASTLPSSVDANPHCGLRQSCSSDTYLVASSIRRLTASFFSSVPLLDVTRPSTTRLAPLGKKRSGSKPPARSVSYSR